MAEALHDDQDGISRSPWAYNLRFADDLFLSFQLQTNYKHYLTKWSVQVIISASQLMRKKNKVFSYTKRRSQISYAHLNLIFILMGRRWTDVHIFVFLDV